MKLFLALLLVVGCTRLPPTTLSPANVGATAPLFTDSAVYRAQCKEADTLRTLTTIPPKCTLRDQRVKIQ